MLRHGAVATDMDRSVPVPASDPARLERMFRAHRGVVWRVLRTRGLAADAAADAAQEVFLVAAQRLSDIQVGRERSFLIGTALHVAQAAHRTRASSRIEPEVEVADERGRAIDD